MNPQLLHSIDYAMYWSDNDDPSSSACFEDEFVSDLLGGLSKHGLVIINNINLTEDEYLKLTQIVGRPLNLPHQLVPSKLPGYPEIARVGNFDPTTGRLYHAKDAAFGEYWHHDGDFWPEGDHHIMNMLHSKIVPHAGGQTGFISTVAAYDLLDAETRRELANSQVIVDPANIEDFRGIAPEDWESENIGTGGPVVHPVVVDNSLEGGSPSLYLPFFDTKLKLRCGRKVSYKDLFGTLFDKDEVKYMHTWKNNQLIVWDNLKVMHRAMGGSEGKRLLWRTQGRVSHVANRENL